MAGVISDGEYAIDTVNISIVVSRCGNRAINEIAEAAPCIGIISADVFAHRYKVVGIVTDGCYGRG